MDCRTEEEGRGGKNGVGYKGEPEESELFSKLDTTPEGLNSLPYEEDISVWLEAL